MIPMYDQSVIEFIDNFNLNRFFFLFQKQDSLGWLVSPEWSDINEVYEYLKNHFHSDNILDFVVMGYNQQSKYIHQLDWGSSQVWLMNNQPKG